MDKLLTFTITSIFIATIIKLSFTYIKNYIKGRKFIKKHFFEDKLYTIDDLANAFNLDVETMINILRMLEKAYVFRKLNSLGVSMDKEYFSRYEMTILVKMLVQKKFKDLLHL